MEWIVNKIHNVGIEQETKTNKIYVDEVITGDG